MTYRVRVTDPAFKAIEEQAHYIAVERRSPEAAARWLEQVFDAADTLGEMPQRRPLAEESQFRPYEIRWIGAGQFMLLFTIVDESNTVWVLNGRHARQLPRPDDLPEDTMSMDVDGNDK